MTFWRKAFEHQARAMINEAVEVAERVYDLSGEAEKKRVLGLFADFDARTSRAWTRGDITDMDFACRGYVQRAREGLEGKVWG